MAWTAPTTRATGDLITASIWNTDLTDNLAYLKTQTDLIDDCTQSDVKASRAINGTEYQNTSGKIRIVAITAYNSAAGDAKYIRLSAYSKATSPVNTIVADQQGWGSTAAGYPIVCNTFVVPPSYYYKCVGAATDTPTLDLWFEWTLH